MLTVIAIGLVGLILISTAMQAQTFEARGSTSQAAELETEQQLLPREVSELESPANVARARIAHGMVPNSNPVYLQLSDGKVRGTPEAGRARQHQHPEVTMSASDVSRRRLRFCLRCSSACSASSACRLFQIQALDMGAYAAKAVEAGTATSTVPAPRGEILDRNGSQLATSVDGRNLTADPKLTAPNAPQIAAILREKLGEQIDYFDTIDKLRTHQLPVRLPRPRRPGLDRQGGARGAARTTDRESSPRR